ncbi:hypothetical protein JXL21_10690 [Candidatus Bathyarchaeota archaeon]|nr:hypothetical protein [Candidatus Bathyarchaeota archaeon]
MQSLRLIEEAPVRKQRRIPARGEVLVKSGDRVEPDTVVVRGVVDNPDIRELRVFASLGVSPDMAKHFMVKEKGDDVARDEVIAIYRSFFGRSTKVARSPIDGRIETFSGGTGRAIIRGHPISLEARAHVPGVVAEVIDGEGAVVETRAAVLQGAFGLGGEAEGALILAVDSRDAPLTSNEVKPEHKGKVIVGGSVATLDALRAAAKNGVSGVVVGGVDQRDLTEFLGYELGLGVTGGEEIGFTLILTEGFGVNPMDDARFSLLRRHEGRVACIDGTTQIRSRILRPEVLIPL